MRATLIYSETCAFCRRWVERVQRWDRYGNLDYLPFQSPELGTRFPQVSLDACRQRMHFVDEDGRVFAGAAAGREVLRRLPLTAPERYLLSRVDGRRTVEAIIQVSPIHELDALRCFKGFLEQGLVEFIAR